MAILIKSIKRFFILIICTAILFTMPLSANAIDTTTLKVAYYPLTDFFDYDADGNEIGYGVDLLNKISQYTGIKFEYVKANNWEDTKSMILDGTSDIRMPATMPKNSSPQLDYGELSIIDTYNVILTMNTRDDLCYQDYDAIDKLTVAVSEDFYNSDSVSDDLNNLGIGKEQIVFCSSYNESLKMLEDGKVDALVSNVSDMTDDMKMLDRFGNESNYISANLDNDFLDDIDDALSKIKLDEPLFLSNLYEEWFPERTSVPLTLEENDYLEQIDSITFAFRPAEGYLSRLQDGEYYGIYVEMAKLICEKLGVKFKAVSIDDCDAGKATTDVYSGFFYDQNYAKEFDFAISSPINNINYYLIQVKEKSIDNSTCKIAAIKKFRYTEEYLHSRYDESQFIYYETYEECLQAVANGTADITIINNYIAEYYLEMYQFSELTARLTSDYSHLFCFAAANNNTKLSEVMNKAISTISDEEMQKAYIRGQGNRPESNLINAFIYKSPIVFAIIVAGIVVFILVMVLLIIMAHKGKKQNKILENALSAKSDFLSHMSHDMRTPMNGILGLSHLMEEEKDITAIKGYIPDLRESGEYLLQLINDVLDVSKIESGNLTISPKLVDEEILFESIIALVKPMIDEKHIDFKFEKHNIDWKYMLLDEQRVKQIFVNLLSNAIKFTPEGGHIDFIMELVSQENGVIRDKFIVRDTGIGMSKEYIPHIFEPFSQEERGKAAYKRGTGLGLPIVKQLVELMDGEIFVNSEVNKGTEITLFINFPLSDNPDKSSNNVIKKETIVLPKGLNILLCEDHPLNAKIATKLLEQKGSNVIWAKNGQIGLDEFKKSSIDYFDVVLMDIRMPIKDGIETTKDIRSLNRGDATTVPIIAMSANAYKEDIEKSLEAGMNEHLAKPVDPNNMFKSINNHLRK